MQPLSRRQILERTTLGFGSKPILKRLAGQPLPGGVEIHQPNNVNTLLPSPWEFARHGQCGMDVSEMLPHTAKMVDDLCFISSMHTEHNTPWAGEHSALVTRGS